MIRVASTLETLKIPGISMKIEEVRDCMKFV